SWAVVLPQMLGMLGLVFADAGVGKAIAHLSTAYISLDARFLAVAVYSIGMFSGYCGTLLTPMAANFNIVPVALLELRDKYGVIRAQAPTALCLLVVNIFLLYLLM
ncbi:5-oxoproline transporter, DUF979 family subunit, partial [Paraburkholderia phenoliruptrix]|uniref:5-oxoproline transporter, DUF979 family subunit n=1 Tax=Paraburkholderia phenoliruptrix TaxID=252970 RepID=UPI00159176C8